MMSSSDTIISVENLTKVFRDFWRKPKVRAVDNVSFTIKRGEIFGLLGPNGSGKSTTIKMLLGLLRPTSGNVTIFGANPQKSSVRSRIGYLPELSYLYKYLTPRETLNYYAGLFNIPYGKRKAKIETLLADAGISAAADRPVGEFSKGMARRVGLAQSLINDPELIILDEPTSGLDPIGRYHVKTVIQNLAKSGATVLLSSHLLSEIEDVCNRVAILCDGRLRTEGELSELLEKKEQIRMTLSKADDNTIQSVKTILEKDGVDVSIDHPSVTLEQYFLNIVKGGEKRE